MLFYGFMETAEKLSFSTGILPFVIVVFIIALGVILLTQQFRKNLYRQKLKEEELKSEYQQEILRASILAQEEERKRIAQDLHDELGATLSIVRMHLLQIEQQNHEAGQSGPALQNARNLTETALSSMRRISHQLMPPQLENFGLLKTLNAVAEQLNKAGNLHVQIVCLNEPANLSWPVKLALYRVCMELINNTIKHAKASKVLIELEGNADYVSCRYTDDGVGLGSQKPDEGLGHKSINGRVVSLGGSVFIGTAVGGGFLCYVKIPTGLAEN